MVPTIIGESDPEVAPAPSEDVQPDAPATPAEPAAPATEDAPGEPEVTPESPDADATPAEGEASSEDQVVYELSIPDDSSMTDADRDSVVEFAKEHELEPTVAQAVLERDAARAAQARADWHATVQEMRAEVEADPKLGGDNLQATIKNAKAAVTHYFGADFADELDRTGFGNNRKLVAGLARIGADMAESTHLAQGGQAASGGIDPAKLFPNSKGM